MEIAFQYFAGFPNWKTTFDRLEEAIGDLGVGIEMQLVETPEEAAARG